jgi:outer membrane autotransporter protein
MDSRRRRTGARFAHKVETEKGLRLTLYVGAAYEHEFDGKARATANGDSIDSLEVKGATGIGELGLTYKPSDASGFSMDFGAQGYADKREGVSGNLQVKFEF